ncbi:bath-42 [Symbiodinium sp. CCMP2592]|nr:bath-42 [Symbiodinium sp. CCMP2592]
MAEAQRTIRYKLVPFARSGTIKVESLHAASEIWKSCFGKGGNFTVIVKEANDASEDVEHEAVGEVEFKVWSFLLAQWSPVFEKMIASDNYVESQRAEVVIQDFSASAVEIFLRFLYSGSIEGSATAMVEVAAIADKYQVDRLHSLCVRCISQELRPELACEVFAAADRFRMEDLRAEARDLIFTSPAAALNKRPAIRPELLEEILTSGLLCIPEDDLREILRSWGTQEGDSLESIINIRTQNQHTKDVLATLWQRYDAAGKKGVFVGYWVSVILGPGLGEAYTKDEIELMAIGGWERFTLLEEGWIQWMLPHSWVHLQGFCFGRESRITPRTSFRIWVSGDGATWHLFCNYHSEIPPPGLIFFESDAPAGLVKCFRLEVLKGELSNISFGIQGILQTPLPQQLE